MVNKTKIEFDPNENRLAINCLETIAKRISVETGRNIKAGRVRKPDPLMMTGDLFDALAVYEDVDNEQVGIILLLDSGCHFYFGEEGRQLRAALGNKSFFVIVNEELNKLGDELKADVLIETPTPPTTNRISDNEASPTG